MRNIATWTAVILGQKVAEMQESLLGVFKEPSAISEVGPLLTI